MADEYIVLDCHAFTDKGMTGNLTISANVSFFLDFNKSSDLSVVTNGAPVEIYEGVNFDVFTEFHIWSYAA